MSIDVNVQNDLVIVTESSEDITVNVSNARGADGVGVPTGGTTGQVLKKLSNTNYDTYWALDGGGVPYSGASGSVNLGAYDLTVNELTIGKGLNGFANNTALGKRTLFHNTTGNYNTAVGHEAGHNITTGQYNTAIGQSAMFTATSAGQNTAIGVNALLLATSGGSNVAVGLDTLQHITTGSSNTAIGYNAGSHITGGATPNTTATNSVFIGRDSKAAADGQTNQIVIGQNAVGNGSNTATFGNTATTANYFTGSINGGSFVKSGGTSSQFLKADGSVDSSSYVGGSGATGQVAYWNGTNSQTGSNNLFWDAANARLGIGTNSPSEALDVSTSVNSAHGIRVSNSNTGNIARSQITILNNSGNQGNLSIWGTGTGLANKVLFESSKDFIIGTDNTTASGGTSKFQIYVNGYNFVTNPQFTLHATGNLSLNNTTDGGQRLQVYGDAFVKGSGATSATNGLVVQNSSSTELVKVDNSGQVFVPNRIIATLLQSTGTATIFLSGGFGSATGGDGIQLGQFTNVTNTSGTHNRVITVGSFLPTSGTGVFNCFNVGATINQTGGANGITRGLYVNPTLTAAADWRSIEWSNNSGWGLYGAGTANNYLAGKLVIGTTTVGTQNLQVLGTALFQTTTGSSTNFVIETLNGDTVKLQIKNNEGSFSLTSNNNVHNITNDNTAISFQDTIPGVRIGSGSGGIGADGNMLLVSGTKNAFNTNSRGIFINTSLVAVANNNTLVGLEVNPTYTNGAFTGVKNYAIKTTGNINMSSLPTSSAGLSAGDLWNDGGTLKIV